jgi:UDP-N-acetylmuramate--alanine ligase
MIALVLERAGLDPTAVIGGRLSAFGSNARLGRGEYMVAEADESDGSFLQLMPSIAVITNIDEEHLESYGSFEALGRAFVEFANKVPFYGSVVACADDARLASLLPHVRRPVVTYGIDDGEAAIVGTDVAVGVFGARCVVHRRGGGVHETLGPLEVAVPGRHNLLNALAAVAAADLVGVPFDRARAALAEFHGAERRFERHGETAGVLVIDDYGHHPTEIAAVLEAARVTLNRRLVVAFQPHRYTRTQQLMAAFGPALRAADEIVLTGIYPAGEDPLPGITIEALAAAVEEGSGRRVHLVPRLDDVAEVLAALARPGDAIITLGAGSIGALPRRVIAALSARERHA